MIMNAMFVNIALNIPSDKIFTYDVPENLRKDVSVGKRVFVPFGNKKRTGFIVGITSSCELQNTKSILEVLDDTPLFDAEDLEFYRWTANYFMYPLGKTLAEVIPSGPEKKDFLWITPLPLEKDVELSAAQQKLFEFLQRYPEGIALHSIAKSSGLKNVSSLIKKLQSAGVIQIQKKLIRQLSPLYETIVSLNHQTNDKLTDKQKKVVDCLEKNGAVLLKDLMEKSGVSENVIKRLVDKGVLNLTQKEKTRPAFIASRLGRSENRLMLNPEQLQALEQILAHLQKQAFAPILLHGVTGSGKTEIYLCAIEEVLKKNGSAMYLVPEIALTPQLIARVTGRFDKRQIAVLHSGISEAVRFDQWRQIKDGKIKLVVGTRSALFAPLPNLKLIIVDEEHDASYKQDERLCYNARDLAVMKAKMAKALVITGSATPSIRTYHNAQTKKYRYLELSRRVDDKPLPVVDIVDMKSLKEKEGIVPILSDKLLDGIRKTLEQKEQVLLFLNKRGFDTFLVCADCGYNFHCPNCAVSLKHHAAEGVVKCHYCDYTIKAAPLCPTCGGNRILSYGVGTQKLEREVQKLFPDARVRRMDSDTTAKKGTQEKILHDLEQKKIDILIGTQMITKGHDFPSITLVGVISADTSLNMPDFRAAEKTFQLITQVAGRGGRGDSPGKVIIQTFNSEHYALKHAQNHDFKAFYREEMELRKALRYPPYSRIINIRLSSVSKDAVMEEAKRLGKIARQISDRLSDKVEIIGPAEAPLAKIRGRHRWQMMIKGENISTLHQLAKDVIAKNKNARVKITADVDPDNFM